MKREYFDFNINYSEKLYNVEGTVDYTDKQEGRIIERVIIWHCKVFDENTDTWEGFEESYEMYEYVKTQLDWEKDNW
jgi:hypothetical protein